VLTETSAETTSRSLPPGLLRPRRPRIFTERSRGGNLRTTDNKLVFVGSPAAFTHSNYKIDPEPAAQFFEYNG
jgi:hypothetical protein